MKTGSGCLTHDLISRYLNQKLSEEYVGLVEQHVHRCRECKELLALAEASPTVFQQDGTTLNAYVADAQVVAQPTRTVPDNRSTKEGQALHEATTPFADQPPAGLCFGHFRVLAELGRGGMGVVFRAEDMKLGRQVAIKVMRSELAVDSDARARFLREARIAASVEHKNIVPILQVGEEQNIPFIVMPLLHGQSLQDLLNNGPTPDLGETVRIGRELALGLAAAHELGLIHRDIKPSNIWLDEGPNAVVRILDFGLARIEATTPQAGAPLTVPGTVLGTPAFMSPEQISGQPVSFPSDLYSLGVLMYRLATGSLPFQADSLYGYLVAHTTQVPAEPCQQNSALPPALGKTIMCLLEKPPAKRPTARALVQALDQRPPSKSNRSRVLVACFAAALFIGVVAFGMRPWLGDERPPVVELPHPDAFTRAAFKKWEDRFKDDQVFLGKMLVLCTHPKGTFESIASVQSEPRNEGKEIATTITVKWTLGGVNTTPYIVTISNREGFRGFDISSKERAWKHATPTAKGNTELLVKEYVDAVAVEMNRANDEKNAGTPPKTRLDEADFTRWKEDLEVNGEQIARLLLAGTHPTCEFTKHQWKSLAFAPETHSVNVAMNVSWRGDLVGLAHATDYEFVVTADNAVPLLKSPTIPPDHLNSTQTILKMKLRTMAAHR